MNRRITSILALVALLTGGGAYYLLTDESNSQPEEATLESQPSNQLPDSIIVATFNIQNLGKNNAFQVRNAARIIQGFDLVAVQEIMNYGEGTKGRDSLRAIVNLLGSNWSHSISSEANGTVTGQPHTFEFSAFLWRNDKLELIPNSSKLWDEDNNPITGLTDQERQFDREPYIASFRTIDGNFDFTVITFHAASPGRPYRRDEIRRLALVYKAIQSADTLQHDVLLCGDFNTPVNKAEWDEVRSISTMTHILTEDNKTTLRNNGELSNNQYDTFWFQANSTNEDVVSGNVVEAWNIDLIFDPSQCTDITDEVNQSRCRYKKSVSDHLPVQIILRTNQDSDKFEDTGIF